MSNVTWAVKGFPVYMVLAIYFPAGLLGVFLFRDRSSIDFFLILILFCVVYFFSFDFFSRMYVALINRKSTLFEVSRRGWLFISFLAFSLYVGTLLYAVWIAQAVPLFVALEGGGLMDIAHSRSQFLAGLVGYESLLRYAAFILGRAVMPLILVAAFMLRIRFRHGFLVLILGLSMLAMEKAAPIFVLLPLMFYYLMARRWSAVIASAAVMLACIVMVTLLARGEDDRTSGSEVFSAAFNNSEVILTVPPGMPIQGAMGDPSRALLPFYVHKYFSEEEYQFDPSELSAKLTLLLNRIVWVPYITAYDWLEFQRLVLDGQLTLGRSISFVHLLFGEPKMQLEKMVYVYEYGASPGGEGASNTVFFVDAKLAFGWIGVVVYCLVFTFCAACIFTSGNQTLIVSSIVCFLVASVSSLTATLLSGGLFIYLILSLLLGRSHRAVLQRKGLSE